MNRSERFANRILQERDLRLRRDRHVHTVNVRAPCHPAPPSFRAHCHTSVLLLLCEASRTAKPSQRRGVYHVRW